MGCDAAGAAPVDVAVDGVVADGCVLDGVAETEERIAGLASRAAMTATDAATRAILVVLLFILLQALLREQGVYG